MDPNTALEKLRAAIARWYEAADGPSSDAEHDAARTAIEHAEALDEWLSNGGFPPDAWARPEPPARER